VQLSKKTMELLLVNYKNIHKAILIDCAYKQKFTKLIDDLEKELRGKEDASI
jgi:hypothetical protein